MNKGFVRVVNPEGCLSSGWSGLALSSLHMAEKRGWHPKNLSGPADRKTFSQNRKIRQIRT